MKHKILNDMSQAEWDVAIHAFRVVLRHVKDLRGTLNSNVLNEIWLDVKEVERTLDDTVKHLQMLSRMHH